MGRQAGGAQASPAAPQTAPGARMMRLRPQPSVPTMTRSSPLPEHPARGSVAMQVRTDRLQLLFRQSFLATFGSVGAALALSWLQHDLGNTGVIAPWLVTLCLAGVVRLGLFWAYHRSAPQHRTPARWEGVYWATLVFAGRMSPPKQFPDDQSIIAAVAQDPTAIAYVKSQALPATVKAVMELPGG